MSYHIVNLHPYEDGYKEVVETFDYYEDADAKFDEWSERLPHAWLEIVPDDELAH